MNVIRLEHLTRRYGRRRGIEDVTLSVSEGSLFGFLGPNGAGKTTAIRVMMGLLRPTVGSAKLFGMDCWRHGRRIKRDVGYLPGDLRLYPWMTGSRALRTFAAIRGIGLMQPGRELAERFGLDLSVKVRAMSRGMRQKLGLILALAHRPKLLILDEPSSALDPLMQESLRAHLKGLSAAGHTIFFSSHSLSEVEQLCDRVAIVRDGRIVADEPLEALRRRAGHEVTIRFRDPDLAARLQPPPGLSLHSRSDSAWQGLLTGELDELIRWLARYSVEDLSIGRPDLERLFRRFYEEGEAK